MVKEKILLWDKDEYHFETCGGFIPFMTAYLHDETGNGEKGTLPCILIIPGGGYVMPAMGEAEPPAVRFYESGFQTFVLTYSTKCLLDRPVGRQAFMDAERAMQILRSRAETFGISPDRIAVCGFSAGGHLAADYTVRSKTEGRPNACVLGYPVITNDAPYAHEESFQALLGSELAAERRPEYSPEKNVTDKTPPMFIWTTATDELVPAENSIRMAKACWEKGVPCELHIYPEGKHGFSVADEKWASGNYGEEYSMDQFISEMQYFCDHEMQLPAYMGGGKLPKGTDCREMFRTQPRDYLLHEADARIAGWTDLAAGWLKKYM